MPVNTSTKHTHTHTHTHTREGLLWGDKDTRIYASHRVNFLSYLLVQHLTMLSKKMIVSREGASGSTNRFPNLYEIREVPTLHRLIYCEEIEILKI